MNAYEITGLIHLLAMSVSMVSAVALVILRKQKIISLTRVNAMVLMLAAFDMVISLMYFIIDYYSVITGSGGVNGFVRVADAWITISLQYVWFLLIKELLFCEEKNIFWKFVRFLYALLLAINLVNYGFIMDQYYYIENRDMRIISTGLEAGEMILTVTINVIIICRIIKGMMRRSGGRAMRKFCLVGLAAILAESLQGAYVGVRLITGITVLQEYNPDTFNITSTARFVFAAALLWFVAKYCVFAQYQKNPADVMKDGEALDMDQRMDVIAAENGLTERETIIARLLYEGSTYRDIAEYLYISVNTVKHHVTSIYRKLDVSSKMEMINYIRSYTAID